MFVIFSEELFLGFETMCNTLSRALVWGGRSGISCTIDSAIMLHYKYLCSRHFSENDFTTAPHCRESYGSDLAAQVMSHTVAVILNALVATGKDHCTVCYELYSVMNEVANEINEGSFSKLLSQEPSSQTNVIVLIYYL
jgi:hypothetical protein